MRSTAARRSRITALLAWTLVLGGCATAPQWPTPGPSASAPSPSAPPAPPASAPVGPAAGLYQEAEAAMTAGDTDRAATLLERALRLEPRNATLWLALARVRDAEGDEAQAEQLALRAVREAGAQAALRRQAWSLIAQLRERRGDSAGADAARRQAAGSDD